MEDLSVYIEIFYVLNYRRVPLSGPLRSAMHFSNFRFMGCKSVHNFHCFIKFHYAHKILVNILTLKLSPEPTDYFYMSELWAG